MRFLLAFALFLGSIDMPADRYVLSQNSYATRFGYTMPGYLDWMAAEWDTPCKDLLFYTGNTSPYGTNTVTVYFYDGSTLVGNQTFSYSPYSEVSLYTSFTYDKVLFINGDGVTDVIQVVWCWWYY